MAPVLTVPINIGHVDDVFELSKAKTPVVPQRFIRDMPERPSAATLSLSTSIPVIDLSKLVNGSKDEYHSEASKLAFACEEWGFFQVINHGIDLDLVESMVDKANDFFMLPLEVKNKYYMVPGSNQGYGQLFIFSEDQKLDWSNMFALGIVPPSIRNQKLWPMEPAQFSETIDEYHVEIGKLSRKLLGFMAKNLGLKEDKFEEMFGVAMQLFRMNYYPPCPRPDLVMGISPHSDGSALTVLQQRKGSSVGLQIRKDNAWVPVEPLPNALIINIGDTLEVVTNGRYKSVEHRAVTDMKKDRLSIASFYAPSFDVDVGPIPELVDEHHPCKYRTYNHKEYNDHYVTNKLQGKKSLEFVKIETTESA